MINDEKSELLEVLELFQKTFSSHNKDEIDQAEKKLKELGMFILYKLS